jgi:hypothetical protein
MTIHAVALCIHVLTAILGLGQIAAMTSLVSAPAESTGSGPLWRALQRLATTSSWSLAVMLLSGLALEYSVGWGYHGFWWFRLSFLGLLALGAILGRTRRTIRKNASSPDGRALQAVRPAVWAMCALVAIITVLMVAKPG